MTEFTIPFDDQIQTGIYTTHLDLSTQVLGTIIGVDFDCWVNNDSPPDDFNAINTNQNANNFRDMTPEFDTGAMYFNPGDYEWVARIHANMSITNKPRITISSNNQLLSSATRPLIPYACFYFIVTQELIDFGLDIEVYMHAHSTLPTRAWMSLFVPDPPLSLTSESTEAELIFTAQAPIIVSGNDLAGRIVVAPDGYKIYLLDSSGTVIPSSSTKHVTVTSETTHVVVQVEPDNMTYHILDHVRLLDVEAPFTELSDKFTTAESVVIPEGFSYVYTVEPASTNGGPITPPPPPVEMMSFMASGSVSPVVILGTESPESLVLVSPTSQLHQVLMSPTIGAPVDLIMSPSEYNLSVTGTEVTISLINDFIKFNNKQVVLFVKVGQQFSGTINDTVLNLDGETYLFLPITLSPDLETPESISLTLADYFPEVSGTFDFTVKFTLPTSSEISISTLLKFDLGEDPNHACYIPEGTVFYCDKPIIINPLTNDYTLKVTRTLVSKNVETDDPSITTYHDSANITSGTGVTLFRFEKGAEVMIRPLGTYILQNPVTGNLDMASVDVPLVPYGDTTPTPVPEPEPM